MNIDIKDFFNINNNVSDDLDEWLGALEYYDSCAINDIEDAVWEQARESESTPLMGNIIQEVVLSKLTKAITNHIIEESEGNVTYERIQEVVTYIINGSSTRFYINNEAVAEEDETKAAIQKIIDESQSI